MTIKLSFWTRWINPSDSIPFVIYFFFTLFLLSFLPMISFYIWHGDHLFWVFKGFFVLIVFFGLIQMEEYQQEMILNFCEMCGCDFEIASQYLQCCDWSMDSGILNLCIEWFHSDFTILWEVWFSFYQNWVSSGGAPIGISHSTVNGVENPSGPEDFPSTSIPLLCAHCEDNVPFNELPMMYR